MFGGITTGSTTNAGQSYCSSARALDGAQGFDGVEGLILEDINRDHDLLLEMLVRM
jgi:hypothetical protein